MKCVHWSLKFFVFLRIPPTAMNQSHMIMCYKLTFARRIWNGWNNVDRYPGSFYLGASLNSFS
jgi:hypothetical protein